MLLIFDAVFKYLALDYTILPVTNQVLGNRPNNIYRFPVQQPRPMPDPGRKGRIQGGGRTFSSGSVRLHRLAP